MYNAFERAFTGVGSLSVCIDLIPLLKTYIYSFLSFGSGFGWHVLYMKGLDLSRLFCT